MSVIKVYIKIFLFLANIMSAPQFKGTNFKFDVGLVDQVADTTHTSEQRAEWKPTQQTVSNWINVNVTQGTLYNFEVLDFHIEGVKIETVTPSSGPVDPGNRNFYLADATNTGAYVIHAKFDYKPSGTSAQRITKIQKIRIGFENSTTATDNYLNIKNMFNGVVCVTKLPAREKTFGPDEVFDGFQFTLVIKEIDVSSDSGGTTTYKNIVGCSISEEENHPSLRFEKGLFYTQPPNEGGDTCECHVNYLSTSERKNAISCGNLSDIAFTPSIIPTVSYSYARFPDA